MSTNRGMSHFDAYIDVKNIKKSRNMGKDTILINTNEKIDDMFILRACEILANSKSPLT